MVFRRYHAPVNLSTRERQLITTLVVLLIVLATFQILADLTEVLSRVADVVIIFVAAWAVSYLLSPLVNRIDQRTPLNRPLSVVVVYIGIAIVLAGTLALAVPGLVSQLNDLIVRALQLHARSHHRLHHADRRRSALAEIHRGAQSGASQRGRTPAAERGPLIRRIHPRLAHSRSDLRGRDPSDPGTARGSVRRRA